MKKRFQISVNSSKDFLSEFEKQFNIETDLERFVNNSLWILKKFNPFEGNNLLIFNKERTALESFLLDERLYSDPERYKQMKKKYFKRFFPLDKRIWLVKVALEKTELYIPNLEAVIMSFSDATKATLKTLDYKSCYYLPLVHQGTSMGTLTFFDTKKQISLKEEEKNEIRKMTRSIAKYLSLLLKHQNKKNFQ